MDDENAEAEEIVIVGDDPKVDQLSDRESEYINITDISGGDDGNAEAEEINIVDGDHEAENFEESRTNIDDHPAGELSSLMRRGLDGASSQQTASPFRDDNYIWREVTRSGGAANPHNLAVELFYYVMPVIYPFTYCCCWECVPEVTTLHRMQEPATEPIVDEFAYMQYLNERVRYFNPDNPCDMEVEAHCNYDFDYNNSRVMDFNEQPLDYTVRRD